MKPQAQENERPRYDFISYEEFLPFMQRMDALEKELIQLKNNQSEYVDTKEALRITGYKRCEALKAARERHGTLIVFKFEGKNNQIPKYLRASLIAYNESRISRPLGPSVACHPKTN